MENYDEIIGFDYTDISEWNNFIRENILSLHTSVSKLLKVREFLESEFTGKKLSEIFEKEQNLKWILLGGVSENGGYKQNSLAKIWKESIGIHLNPDQWISLMKEEKLDANDWVNCKFFDTSFLEFIREIKKLTDDIALNRTNEEINIEESVIRNFINNPEKILDEIKNIYKLITKVSANYNYHTFFILSTRSITRKYLELAYPKLRTNFDELANFISLEPLFTLELTKEANKMAYTIWSQKENDFADCIYKLNEIIWNYFDKEEIRKFFGAIFSNVRNLKQEYLEKAKQKLNEINWKFPDYIQTTDKVQKHISGHSGPWTYTYKISGLNLNSYRAYGCSARGNWGSYENTCNIPLLKLLDELSPGLFLLHTFELKVSDSRLEVIK